MAAPNIANLTTITGVSTFVAGISTTSGTVIISNPASSNSVYKVNSLIASNTTNVNVNVFVKIFNQAAGAGTSVSIASSITVPAGSSLTVIGKDIPIYLEENRSMWVLAGSATTTTSATNSIDVVASYESIA